MANSYSELTNPSSVEANRAGILTAEQQARLKRLPSFNVGLIFALLLVAFGFLAPLLGSLGGIPSLERGAICTLPCSLVAAGLIYLAFRSLSPLQHLRPQLHADLVEGQVMQGEGEVIFTQHGYTAWLNGTRLRTYQGYRTVHLPPGPCRFYYLPRSRALLSAEPLAPILSPTAHTSPAADPLARVLEGLPGHVRPVALPSPFLAGEAPSTLSESLAAVQGALARANHFSPEDLVQNRLGLLTSQQSWRLLTSAAWQMALGIPFGVVAAFLLGSALQQALPAPVGLLMGAAFAVAVLAMLGSALWRILDALGRRALATEGVVTAQVDSGGESTTLYYAVQGTPRHRRFAVGQRAFKALVSGMRYRIYYAPRSRRLVSIEVLPIEAEAAMLTEGGPERPWS